MQRKKRNFLIIFAVLFLAIIYSVSITPTEPVTEDDKQHSLVSGDGLESEEQFIQTDSETTTSIANPILNPTLAPTPDPTPDPTMAPTPVPTPVPTEVPIVQYSTSVPQMVYLQNDRSRNMEWASVYNVPLGTDIQYHNSVSQKRSPYICGWFFLPNDAKYKEYMIDFKASHLPKGTYCSLGNWFMDYSMIEKEWGCTIIDSGIIHAYAGLQNIYNGDKVGIMSFWDVYYIDQAGVQQTLRAKRIYPVDATSKEEFTGEGTGAHCSVPYAWEENHWYRMHLRCSTSNITGNTTVEQWVCDLESEQYTLICAYDIGVKNSLFKGNIAFFLENYMAEYSGEVRSMEVCNARYLDANTNQWIDLKEAYISSNGGLPDYDGSYCFGSQENRFWMITSGVGGDWFNNGTGQQGATYRVQ